MPPHEGGSRHFSFENFRQTWRRVIDGGILKRLVEARPARAAS
jgi:hypothetical protein